MEEALTNIRSSCECYTFVHVIKLGSNVKYVILCMSVPKWTEQGTVPDV